ncbi:MAG: sulfatase activating formylglycine-generating enzyme [Myxococcota bacterium]|jgi:formylglycine-generating enzyme required for sulfatase activity
MLLPALLATLALAQDSTQERGIEVVNEDEVIAQPAYARRHALIVGINAYKDPAYPDLGYAVADAEAVAAILIEDYGFAQEDMQLILNKDATKARIEKELEEWACDYDRVGEDDLLVVFFAGHGVTRDLRNRGDRGYLVPVDGRAGSGGAYEWSSLLAMNDLEDVSEAIPAKHVLFILDCCFGGLAVKRSPAPIAAGLSNRARQVITAGNADQAVLDAGGGGHSVFTGALLDALRGDADLDSDQVVTFGELYSYIGRDVERKTEMRQTPLQASLPDHEGGNVALFAPGVTPGMATAAQRLKALERTAEERLAEVERLSDVILIEQLLAEADGLYPMDPELIPAYQGWLARARELAEHRLLHEESTTLVRQEAHLKQVVAGLTVEGEGAEPRWGEVDPKLRWRFDTFTALVEKLDVLDEVITDVETRRENASRLWQMSIGDRQAEWQQAVEAIANLPAYEGLALPPQLGLVPLGADPDSGLWEFAHVLTGAVAQRDFQTGQLGFTAENGLVLVLVPGGRQPPIPDETAQISFYRRHFRAAVDPFLLSKYEMTEAQWGRIATRSIDRRPNPPNERLEPMTGASYNMIKDVLLRVDLTLPSAHQWQYAARAGASWPWWCGDEERSLEGCANLTDVPAEMSHGGWNDGFARLAPVGALRPNPFGLHNVHGNAWEWCSTINVTFPDADSDGLLRVGASLYGGAHNTTARHARLDSNTRGATDVAGANPVGVRPTMPIKN